MEKKLNKLKILAFIAKFKVKINKIHFLWIHLPVLSVT